MKSNSAARSGYGPAVLRRLALHTSNLAMALLCAAGTFSVWILVAGGTPVLGAAASLLFSFVALMLATAAIPAERVAAPARGPTAIRAPQRPAATVVKPPPLPPVFTPTSQRVAQPPAPLEIGNDLDRAYAVLDAEWADLNRIARQRRPQGRVLAA